MEGYMLQSLIEFSARGNLPFAGRHPMAETTEVFDRRMISLRKDTF